MEGLWEREFMNKAGYGEVFQHFLGADLLRRAVWTEACLFHGLTTSEEVIVAIVVHRGGRGNSLSLGSE
jgi:hypothetical protein